MNIKVLGIDPAIAQSWHRNWDRVIPFFAFSEAVRKIIYTTNAVEALKSKLRRAVKNPGPLSEHLCRDENDVPGLARCQCATENTAKGMEGSKDPVPGTVRHRMTINRPPDR
ncbi:hypothetical protein CSC94_22390 [Zhengella mangrovi]|uniref:Mutator family transposase n=1 Tax=Zhengella mangrovi TaxID=1982044 RepID=A0A2G1QH09_9HYPH|nr:hypothetical protein CSC94_22390 [Zhengella mangrovi]